MKKIVFLLIFFSCITLISCNPTYPHSVYHLKQFNNGSEMISYFKQNDDTIIKNVLYYDIDLEIKYNSIDLRYSLKETSNYFDSYIVSSEFDRISVKNEEKDWINQYAIQYRFKSYFFEGEIGELRLELQEDYTGEKLVYDKLINIYSGDVLLAKYYYRISHDLDYSLVEKHLLSRLIIFNKNCTLKEKIITEPKESNIYYDFEQYMKFYKEENISYYGSHLYLKCDEHKVDLFKYDDAFFNNIKNLKLVSRCGSYLKVKNADEPKLFGLEFTAYYTKQKIELEKLEFEIINYYIIGGDGGESRKNIYFYLNNERIGYLCIYDNKDEIDLTFLMSTIIGKIAVIE